jgi:hypothetical protein
MFIWVINIVVLYRYLDVINFNRFSNLRSLIYRHVVFWWAEIKEAAASNLPNVTSTDGEEKVGNGII